MTMATDHLGIAKSVGVLGLVIFVYWELGGSLWQGYQTHRRQAKEEYFEMRRHTLSETAPETQLKKANVFGHAARACMLSCEWRLLDSMSNWTSPSRLTQDAGVIERISGSLSADAPASLY
jgi:hypothetical protein